MTGGPGLQVTVVDTSNVQVVYPTATTASTQKPPLLALELQVLEGSSISCKTDLDSIVPRMLAVFDKAIIATQVSIMHHLSQCVLLSGCSICSSEAVWCKADAV